MRFTLRKGKDKIEVEVLDDGRLKISTDGISSPNHANATSFVNELAKMQGGKTTRNRKASAKAHAHAHEGVFHEH